MTLKITGGIFRGRKLASPKGETRPTQSIVRQAVFNICQNDIVDASFLDLFAGSGIMGLEALSRGAATAVFVENNRETLRCIKKNIELLQINNAIVFSLDINAVKKTLLHFSFDVVYIDPPYDVYKSSPQIILQLLNDLIDGKLVKKNTHIFLEGPLSQNIEIMIPHLKLLSKRKYGASILNHFRII